MTSRGVHSAFMWFFYLFFWCMWIWCQKFGFVCLKTFKVGGDVKRTEMWKKINLRGGGGYPTSSKKHNSLSRDFVDKIITIFREMSVFFFSRTIQPTWSMVTNPSTLILRKLISYAFYTKSVPRYRGGWKGWVAGVGEGNVFTGKGIAEPEPLNCFV